MTRQITCFPSPSLGAADCTLATLTIVLQALPILTTLLTMHSVTLMYVALNTLHDHHNTTNTSQARPPDDRRSPAAVYFFQHRTYSTVQGLRYSQHCRLRFISRWMCGPDVSTYRTASITGVRQSIKKTRWRENSVYWGLGVYQLAERVTTCNVSTQNVNHHITFSKTRGLCNTEFLLTPKNAQFYSLYVLSIIQVLHVLAKLPFSGSLQQSFINA